MYYNLKIFLLLYCVLTIILSCSFDVYAQSKTKTISIAFEDFKNDEAFKHASIGFMAKDIESGEILFQFNPHQSLTPASVVKVISTATALELLGENHRFETQIAYHGTIDSAGVLNGSVYILGGGDPVLGSEYFEGHYLNENFADKWVNAISGKGIKQINGKIIGYSGYFGNKNIPDTWNWSDINNYYGAAPNGLMIFENIYRIVFNTKAKHKTKIIKLEPDVVELDIKNEVLPSESKSDNAYIYGSPFSSEKFVQGTIPKNRFQFRVKGAIPNSALVAAKYLHKKLDTAGVGVTGNPIEINTQDELPDLNLIYTTYSPPLTEIIKRTNKKSVNILAESFLYHAAISTDSCEGPNDFIPIVKSFWEKKGMDVSGMFLYDGCGLSRYNAISAEDFVFILEYMRKESDYFEAFYNSLPVAGVSGTMKYMCRGTFAAGNLRAKSGTISGVKGYAGYLKTKSGRAVAFCVMVNNFNCSSKQTNRKLEKLMIQMAESQE